MPSLLDYLNSIIFPARSGGARRSRWGERGSTDGRGPQPRAGGAPRRAAGSRPPASRPTQGAPGQPLSANRPPAPRPPSGAPDQRLSPRRAAPGDSPPNRPQGAPDRALPANRPPAPRPPADNVPPGAPANRPAPPTYRPMAMGEPYRPIPRRRIPAPPPAPRHRPAGCLPAALVGLLLLACLSAYLLFPAKTTLLLIGIDYIDDGTRVARSDTIMLAQVDPLPPRVSLLSIPRDLWVAIPGQGENRINTAHFYAESLQPGSGPVALRRTIDQNFGVDAPYYVRVQFRGFRDVVDAMGGVDIYLDEATAGYPPGQHHLTGRKALAFVRSRADSDDFQRMGQGQMMLRAMFQTMLNPLKWLRLPAIIRAGLNAIDTNLPAWHFPRIAMALLRLGPAGIDSHIVDRNMTTPFTTSEGAQVLLPDWGQIGDLTRRLFK